MRQIGKREIECEKERNTAIEGKTRQRRHSGREREIELERKINRERDRGKGGVRKNMQRGR